MQINVIFHVHINNLYLKKWLGSLLICGLVCFFKRNVVKLMNEQCMSVLDVISLYCCLLSTYSKQISLQEVGGRWTVKHLTVCCQVFDVSMVVLFGGMVDSSAGRETQHQSVLLAVTVRQFVMWQFTLWAHKLVTCSVIIIYFRTFAAAVFYIAECHYWPLLWLYLSL